jgi:hypothetical protein
MTFEPAILVLLGVSGAGKDTAASFLQGQNPKLINVKFSDPIKQALAAYLGVDRALMDDREWRTTVIPELGCTPLDILVKSFDYMPQIHPRLGLVATGRQCRSILESGGQIVFTDMRNLAERNFVVELASKYAVPLFVYQIHRRDAQPQSSDRLVSAIYHTLRPYHVQTVGRIPNNGSLPEFQDALSWAFRGTPFKLSTLVTR